jgi:hypothetical protein
MSLANFGPGKSPDPSRRGAPIPADDSPEDPPVEPGFLQARLDQPLSGLDSFGSEENDDKDDASHAREAEVGFSNNAETVLNDRPPLTIAPTSRPDPAIGSRLPLKHAPTRVDSPSGAPSQEISKAQLESGPRRKPQLTRLAGSLVSSIVMPSWRALGSAAGWSRAHLDLRVAGVTILIVGGLAEAGWIGVRVATGATGLFDEDAPIGADATELAPRSGLTAGGTIRITVRTTPAPTPLRNSNAPGWVAISSPAPVEVLEHGRVIGASWNGGVRLPPGRHDLRIVNRASGIDAEQTLDIPAGSTTSMVLDTPPSLVAINAVPWAAVQVDGAAVGNTPLVGLPLAAGSHELIFSHPKLGRQRMTVAVASGKSLEVRMDLRR